MGIAAWLRFTGLNWDQTYWIHPDEGHMRMVTAAIRIPHDLGVYFDTARSPLNPANNRQIYSYGTLPIFTTRLVAEIIESGCSPVGPHLLQQLASKIAGTPPGRCSPGTFTWTYSAFLGRHLSALADLGTVLMTYLIGRTLYGRRAGLLAMALAAFTAFMIQQAHFYTVDSAATFFTALTAWLAMRAATAPLSAPPWFALLLGGISTGLASACKISAVLAAGLVVMGGVTWALRRIQHPSNRGTMRNALIQCSTALIVAGILALFAFRLGQPYAFRGPTLLSLRLDPTWVARLKQIAQEQSGALDYPSGRQWTNRVPVIFPWINMVLWGMGLPLGLAAWAGWGLWGRQLARGHWKALVLWPWATTYFVFYATRWVKAMRYFLPLYPLLVVMAAYALIRLQRRAHVIGRGAMLAVLALTYFWGTAMVGVYLRPHTRILGSQWIFTHVAPGSTIANEHWDWGLPLRLGGRDPFENTYRGLTLTLYDEDTPEKREKLLAWLDEADVIVMASNRLYASIARLPDRYPLTTTYYRALLKGQLGFHLEADITSYLAIGPFIFPDQEAPYPIMTASFTPQGMRIPFPLPPAEESFSVYDHPRVLIFRKTAAYSHTDAAAILRAVDLSTARLGQTPRQATPALVLKAHNVAFALGFALTAGITFASGLAIFRQCEQRSRMM